MLLDVAGTDVANKLQSDNTTDAHILRTPYEDTGELFRRDLILNCNLLSEALRLARAVAAQYNQGREPMPGGIMMNPTPNGPTTPTLEEDLQVLRRLSNERSDSLRDFFHEVFARNGDAPELARWKDVFVPGKLRVFLASAPERNLLPDFNWIMAHSQKHRGEWVAISGGQLLAHGADYEQVVSQARSTAGSDDFLLMPCW